MKTKSIRCKFAVAVAVAGLLSSAFAASPSIWNGGGLDDNWNNAANWSGNVPAPATNYALQFAGTTRLTPSNDFPALSNFGLITFNSGAGAFTLSGNSITLNNNIVNSSSSLQTINLDMALASNRLVSATSGNVTLGGVISGGFGLNTTGANTVLLKGVNTYTGVTTISGNNMLAVENLANGGSDSGLGKSSSAVANLVIADNATLSYRGSADASTDRLFSVSGAAVNGATLSSDGVGTMSFTATGGITYTTNNTAKIVKLAGTNTGNNTFSLLVANNGSGTVALAKSGVGKWILTGANTYTGTTTVTAGTLIVNGGQTGATGAITVSAGATLGGIGTMGSTTTNLTTSASTSVLAPGDGGVGKLSIGGAGNFASGATFKMELGTAATAGTTYDQLAIGGILTGSAAGNMKFDFTNLGSAQAGTPYKVLTFGSVSGFTVTDLAMINSPGFTLDIGFNGSGWKINGTDLEVQFSAVPEPATWALLAFSLTTVMVLRRRRTRL